MYTKWTMPTAVWSPASAARSSDLARLLWRCLCQRHDVPLADALRPEVTAGRTRARTQTLNLTALRPILARVIALQLVTLRMLGRHGL